MILCAHCAPKVVDIRDIKKVLSGSEERGVVSASFSLSSRSSKLA